VEMCIFQPSVFPTISHRIPETVRKSCYLSSGFYLQAYTWWAQLAPSEKYGGVLIRLQVKTSPTYFFYFPPILQSELLKNVSP